MLFLSIVLFSLYTISFVNGGLAKGLAIKNGENKIKYAKGEVSKENYDADNIAFGFIAFILLLIILGLELPVIIMGMGSSNVLIKFASVGYLLYMIVVMVWSGYTSKKTQNPDLSNDDEVSKYRKKLYKGRTFFGSILTIIQAAYFGFIVYQVLLA